MFAKRFTKFTVALILGGFALITSTVVHADASPWEQSHNVDITSVVHHQNQVYYSIDNNDPNAQLVQKAINAWNRLGVIRLIKTDSATSNIKISTQDFDSSDDKFGVTNLNTIYNGETNQATINSSTININPGANVVLPDNILTSVIEHEIGHALGFDHDDTTTYSKKLHEDLPLVMNPSSTTNYDGTQPLGSIEQHALAQHYQLTPKKGFQNNNY